MTQLRRETAERFNKTDAKLDRLLDSQTPQRSGAGRALLLGKKELNKLVRRKTSSCAWAPTLRRADFELHWYAFLSSDLASKTLASALGGFIVHRINDTGKDLKLDGTALLTDCLVHRVMAFSKGVSPPPRAPNLTSLSHRPCHRLAPQHGRTSRRRAT